jgi:ElaB/YqjD/DUF883 family membrane-anchored ribosome-binding protein
MSNDQGQSGNQGSSTEQLKDKASAVGQSIRDVGGNIRDAANEQYENVRDQASQYYEQGRQKAEEWEHGVEQYIQEKPVQALLIAAGVGMLVGLLWKSR